MKQQMIQAHMAVAETYATLSYAKRLKVGAIVVKDNRVISIGYNGTPSGWDNNCEEIIFVPDSAELDYNTMAEQGFTFGAYSDTAGWVKTHTKPEVIHAEANAIAKLARSNEAGENATMFVTHAPCIDCAKLIFGSGINTVFYRNTYRDDLGLKFLEKCGVSVSQV